MENCVCLLRNLSYQVHREIPHAERYQEAPLNTTNNAGPHAASCFGAKKGKGMFLSAWVLSNFVGDNMREEWRRFTFEYFLVILDFLG